MVVTVTSNGPSTSGSATGECQVGKGGEAGTLAPAPRRKEKAEEPVRSASSVEKRREEDGRRMDALAYA